MVPVAVCVPIVVILLFVIVAFSCWQVRYVTNVRGHEEPSAKLGIYDVSEVENQIHPPAEMIMNGNGAVHHYEVRTPRAKRNISLL